MNQCPLCKSEMKEMGGEKTHPGDYNFGTTVYCPNPNCPAEEVAGHGKNVKEAMEVVTHKYTR